MTVLDERAPFTQYIGDGVTTYFAFAFYAPETSGILVYLDDVPSDYERDEGGVTLTPAPGVGVRIDIYRATALTQERDWTAQDAFIADWTEAACDKLILLKQEAAFNLAKMNLVSQPFLDNVTLQNSAGTNAVILIWNVETAGVYAGEVAETIPAAGSVVEKPENFVYKQWQSPAVTQTLTTTLYPVEAYDGLKFGVSIGAASMSKIPIESNTVSFEALSGTLQQILKDGGDYFESNTVTFEGLDGTLVTLFKSVPSKFESNTVTFESLDGTLESKLVTAYTNPEGLLFGAGLNAAQCTMTLA